MYYSIWPFLSAVVVAAGEVYPLLTAATAAITTTTTNPITTEIYDILL